jgi:hypothetical protein
LQLFELINKLIFRKIQFKATIFREFLTTIGRLGHSGLDDAEQTINAVSRHSPGYGSIAALYAT